MNSNNNRNSNNNDNDNDNKKIATGLDLLDDISLFAYVNVISYALMDQAIYKYKSNTWKFIPDWFSKCDLHNYLQ